MTDMDRWRGRTALVTGASSGIGYAVAETLTRQGLRVYGCARRVELIQDLSDRLRQEQVNWDGTLTAVKCDLTNEEDVLRMFEKIKQECGHIDILINNAGTVSPQDLITGNTEKWRQMLEVNVLALSVCSREALRLMDLDQINDGHIININSLIGHEIAANLPITHFYSGTKHMVTALTKALNAELRQMKSRIRVTSLSPVYVKTGIRDLVANENPEERDRLEKTVSCPFLTPQEIADAVVYILGTPPHVNIRELTIVPTDHRF